MLRFGELRRWRRACAGDARRRRWTRYRYLLTAHDGRSAHSAFPVNLKEHKEIAAGKPTRTKSLARRPWGSWPSRSPGDPSPPAVWFAYSTDRKGEHPQSHPAISTAPCRQMRSPVSTRSTKIRLVASAKRRAWPTFAASSTTSTKRTLRAGDRSAAADWRAVRDRK